MWPFRAALTSVLAVVATGCLPGDTRPEPGSLFTTVSGSQATRDGFDTVDGWNVSFDSVLVCAGPMQLGDDCQKYAEYSEPGYDRVLQLVGPERQKLGIMYGLGRCDVDFELSAPSQDAVLGSGVSGADKTAMRTAGSDPFEANVGTVLHVEGKASRGAEVVAFDWSIRQPLYFKECRATVNGATEQGIALEHGTRLEYDLLLEAEGLFRDNVDRELAALRFDPFARADADDDGLVTLGELHDVALDDLRTNFGPYAGSDTDTLAGYLYHALWPSLLRYRRTGSCQVGFEDD